MITKRKRRRWRGGGKGREEEERKKEEEKGRRKKKEEKRGRGSIGHCLRHITGWFTCLTEETRAGGAEFTSHRKELCESLW